MTTFTLLELRRGKVRPLGPKGVSSGIFKERVEGALKATPDGLEGDEQGDRRHHGALKRRCMPTRLVTMPHGPANCRNRQSFFALAPSARTWWWEA